MSKLFQNILKQLCMYKRALKILKISFFTYFQSLVQPKAYIVTQGPTETTIGDYWRMVWQERASCIVMVTRTFDFIRVCGKLFLLITLLLKSCL